MTRSDWMAQVLRLARIGQDCARTGDDVSDAVGRGTPDSQDRRRLMQAAVGGVAAAGLGVMAPPLLAATAQDARTMYARLTNTRGVAVVGAGLAGLACATELTRLGVPAKWWNVRPRSPSTASSGNPNARA